MIPVNKRPQFAPVCMCEEYWRNSHFSIAHIYGGIHLSGVDYYIVNKKGETIFEISARMEKEGKDGKAIPPGEPADLVRMDFIRYYRQLGRDKFIEVLKANNNATTDKLIKIYEELINNEKRDKSKGACQ